MMWKVTLISLPGLSRVWTKSFPTKREAVAVVRLYQQISRVGRTYFILGR